MAFGRNKNYPGRVAADPGIENIPIDKGTHQHIFGEIVHREHFFETLTGFPATGRNYSGIAYQDINFDGQAF